MLIAAFEQADRHEKLPQMRDGTRRDHVVEAFVGELDPSGGQIVQELSDPVVVKPDDDGVRSRRFEQPGPQRSQVDGAGCSVLVVCEVKARTSNSLGNPFEAVTHSKQHRLRCLATAYLSEQDTYYDHIRFDVVGVSGRALRVVENAF